MTSGKVIGVSYHVTSSKCVKSTGTETSHFQTGVRVKYGEEAPRPNLDPLNTGKTAVNPGVPVVPAEAQQEQGFFQKYVRFTFSLRLLVHSLTPSVISTQWHYLLPIPVMLLMAGICNGEDSKGKGKRTGAAPSGAKK